MDGLTSIKMDVGVLNDLGYFEVDNEVEQNTLQALEKFKSLGATVTEVKLNWKKDTSSYTIGELPTDLNKSNTNISKNILSECSIYFLDLLYPDSPITLYSCSLGFIPNIRVQNL